jgi:hypothetical protein
VGPWSKGLIIIQLHFIHQVLSTLPLDLSGASLVVFNSFSQLYFVFGVLQLLGFLALLVKVLFTLSYVLLEHICCN